MLANHEMRWTFVEGHFMATVLTAQVFAEQTLGSQLILAGEDEAAEGGMASILRRSLELDWISEHLAARVRELHRMRIAYGHTHVGLKNRSLMKRFIDAKAVDIWEYSEAEARSALQIVVDILRSGQPSWNPEAPECRELMSELYGEAIEADHNNPEQLSLF